MRREKAGHSLFAAELIECTATIVACGRNLNTIVLQRNYKHMEKIVIVKWKLKELEASRILKMLPELAEKIRNEKGNLSYTIYQSESDPRELILHEHYVDASAAKHIDNRNTTRESS